MSATFDPYEQWLDIPRAEQPPDYYRLLGLARFESDANKIRSSAEERMARLRTYQSGPRGIHTQKLLNELAAARGHLLDPLAKAQYDQELARRLSALEATRRIEAARPLQEAAEPPPPSLPPVSIPHGTKRRSQALGWLAAGCLFAGLAAGTWFFLRVYPASSKTVATPESSPVRQPSGNAKTAIETSVVKPDTDGTVLFLPGTASLSGSLRNQTIENEQTIGGWSTADSIAKWPFRVQRPNFFLAEITYAAEVSAAGTQLELRVGNRLRTLTLRDTGGLTHFETDSLTVAIERRGDQALEVRLPKPSGAGGLLLRSVRLVPMNPGDSP